MPTLPAYGLLRCAALLAYRLAQSTTLPACKLARQGANPSQGEGVASSSHGNKRSRGIQEVPMKDARMPQQPPQGYRLCWVTKQEVMSREARIWLKIICACLVPENHVTHIKRERVCLMFSLMIERLVNVELRMSGVMEEKLQYLNMDYLSNEHWRALCRVGPCFEEPFNDDDATNEEQAGVNSNLESDDNGDDSEMREASFAPTDDED
ncbi:hypothetical protein HAX54_005778 [Datura stramonium]|uniref:Uncharacterized protein n=1 Tax=Datura stramonium TaxID=4076 RepID=A0ABS8WYI9_DATST|nr:hypothetical protein [Datura stramonium]